MCLIQDIVEGKLGSRASVLNGFSHTGDSEVALARVHDIFPPQGNTGVSAGVVFIESGEFIDHKAVFDRKDCWLFGWSLDADAARDTCNVHRAVHRAVHDTHVAHATTAATVDVVAALNLALAPTSP